jgi:hypothetical protein
MNQIILLLIFWLAIDMIGHISFLPSHPSKSQRTQQLVLAL